MPCLRLGEDGKWLGVLKEVVLNIPRLLTKAAGVVKLVICPVWQSFG
jgi:hypothetical protein